MPRLNTPTDVQERTNEPPPCNPNAIVAQALWRCIEKHGALPQPLPSDVHEATQWWMGQMQEPKRDHEDRIAPIQGHTEGQRWECGYGVRCRQALAGFLAMTDEERGVVVRLVKSGVPYRGDTFEQFLLIANATEHLREVGVQAFAREAVRDFKKLMTAFA
jgi:hypothetical protein